MRRPLDDSRPDLARQRLALLRRETANLREARRILEDMERSPDLNSRIVEEARRSVSLAEAARRLGVIDAHRVGASTADLAAAADTDEATIASILDRL